MQIEAIRTTYPDEWIAAEIHDVTRAEVPRTATVIAHSTEKNRAYRAAKEYLARNSQARLFIFFTGDPIPADLEVALAIS